MGVRNFMYTALILALSAAVTSTNLYVSSYTGNITILSFTESNGSYSLKSTSTSGDCAPNPAWLTIDTNRGLLFCLNEGLATVNGSLSSFTINTNGTLSHVKNQTTISGPVSGVIYGENAGRRAIALVHYTGSAVTSWYLDGNGQFSFNQAFTYNLSQPGPNAGRQDAPHEHEAITDPTGQYILVPDLGADVVRVFSWAAGSLKLTELAPLKAAAGSGPRHAAFWNPYGVACDSGCSTYLYVVGELTSTVTGYAVTYLPNRGGLSFKQVYASSTFGTLKQPKGNAPAEILVTPDNRFLMVSNRNDSSFALPPANNTMNIPQSTFAGPANASLPQTSASDSIATFKLNEHDGSLSLVQLAPAGGVYPRHFTINAMGNLVAVGLQYDNTTVIWNRDVETGLMGDMVAKVGIDGNVTCVLFG